MKMYCEARSLRLVGKAWEVRAKLKQLSTSDVPLTQWLEKRRSPGRFTSRV